VPAFGWDRRQDREQGSEWRQRRTRLLEKEKATR